MTMTDYEKPFQLRSERATDTASADLSQLFNNWFKVQGPTAIFKTCASCQFMPKVGAARCEKFNATPPIDVIMRGCDNYQDVRLAPKNAAQAARVASASVVERVSQGIRPLSQADPRSICSDLDDDIPF